MVISVINNSWVAKTRVRVFVSPSGESRQVVWDVKSLAGATKTPIGYSHPPLWRGISRSILYQSSSKLNVTQSCMYRIYGIDLELIFDRAALCHNHKPVSLLYTLDTVLLICRRQIFLFFTDSFFYLLDIVNSVSPL